jgi:hypothetical protein
VSLPDVIRLFIGELPTPTSFDGTSPPSLSPITC